MLVSDEDIIDQIGSAVELAGVRGYCQPFSGDDGPA
jgi:hypothetical protein